MITFITTLCIIWCFLLSGTLALSLTIKFPLDILAEPLSSVKIITLVTGGAYIALAALSSARFSAKSIFKCCFIVGLSCIVYHFIAVLFGAPAIE